MDEKPKSEARPQYWLDVANKKPDPTGEFPGGFANELFEIADVKKTRREFLSLLGFTVAAPTLVSCTRIPVGKAVGFVNREEGTTPGVANWFATTCSGCEAGCGLHVKTREGRAIKIEGNPASPYSRGGTCAVGQATVLSLYDSARFSEPKISGVPVPWAKVDAAVPAELVKASEKGKIVLLTGRVRSPSTGAAIEEFRKKYPRCEHLTYEPVSYSALFQSFERSHGRRSVPRYSLSDVESLVSVGADFLGTWYAPVAFAKDYSARRDVVARKGAMLRHIQFEALMSLSGSNADLRVPVSATEESLVLMALLNEIGRLSGKNGGVAAVALDLRLRAIVTTVARELWQNRGKSLVLCGSNRVDDQVVANAINELLDNFGTSIELQSTKEATLSTDGEFESLVSDMLAGKVAALLVADVNPAYAYYDPEKWANAVKKVPLQISFSAAPDETNQSAQYLCPGNHFLESWNDHSLGGGRYGLTQPTMETLRATRMYQESLLRWAGRNESYLDFIRSIWKRDIFPRQKKIGTFDGFWNDAVHDGSTVVSAAAEGRLAFRAVSVTPPKAGGTDFELVLYEKAGVRDGRHANNPWLQELPDPITKASWDNYAALSPKVASRLGVKAGDLVSVESGSTTLKLPVLVQAGLGEQVVAVALGYGRTRSGKAGDGVGHNAFPWVRYREGTFQRSAVGVQVKKVPGHYDIALTQTHHLMEGRDLVREVKRGEALHPEGHSEQAHAKAVPSLWPEHKAGENRWGMAINLSKCTGCSACVIGCQSENNVPVVGREEVLKRREMHWIRIDRYYTGDEANPGVVHQPVTCQHCENAPCETVCPVLATVHSSDGLNQQVYNRCVGTRYCANNCPYKVRRFNWFDYSHDDPWGRMALNPDITVRSRGVMEKCSFCVQRIQEARAVAMKEGRKVADGDFKVACEQSCPSDAIVFGDLADPRSKLSQVLEQKSGYELLSEINVRPRVTFLPKVRNPL